MNRRPGNKRLRQTGGDSEPGRARPRNGQDRATFAGERAASREADRRRSVERSAELEPRRQEIAAALDADPVSRRAFLRNSALAAGGLAAGLIAGPMVQSARASVTAPRIAIVGAGVGGLTAAYRIYTRKGWVPTVYEASARVGGRTRTIRGLSGGHVAEAGAAGIDTRHRSLRWLANELGLWPLTDTWVNYPSGPYLYYFGGEFHYPDALDERVEVDGDDAWWLWKKKIGFLPQWNRSNAVSQQIDNMTVAEYLEQNTNYPGDDVLSAFQRASLAPSYGGTIDQMSALVYVLNYSSIWGGAPRYNERYVIPGGMDTLATTLKDRLPPGTVQHGKRLVAVRQQAGTVVLTFDVGTGSSVDVTVDKAIIAIPPPVLNTVDLTNAGFDARMMRVIQGEKLGGNSKLNFQFAQNVWGNQGRSGDAITDTATGWSWNDNYQAYQPAVHVSMNNLDYGSAPAHGVAPPAVVAQTLAAIDQLYPGASAQVISGQTYLDYWPNDPLALGSYGYYSPGAFTDYGGYEKVRQGNVHFAGEHTAPYIDRGYVNGAVISGERAATEITGW